MSNLISNRRSHSYEVIAVAVAFTNASYLLTFIPTPAAPPPLRDSETEEAFLVPDLDGVLTGAFFNDDDDDFAAAAPPDAESLVLVSLREAVADVVFFIDDFMTFVAFPDAAESVAPVVCVREVIPDGFLLGGGFASTARPRSVSSADTPRPFMSRVTSTSVSPSALALRSWPSEDASAPMVTA